MKRLFHALALCALLPSVALSRTAMETNQLVDDNGVPIGTAANPLYTTGGGGGGAVSQGSAASDTTANRWPVIAYQGGLWAVGLTGTLPAFATTPTFNLGTLNGAATAANQSSEIAALGATNDTAYAGSGTASIISTLKGIYNGLLAATPAGSNVIGKVGIDQTTPGTTNAIAVTTSPAPTAVTRARFVCTLPAYASGGNAVCTDQAGAQVTNTCAANTACLISAANASRKTMAAQVKTAGVSVDIGYAASLAPASGITIDGPATSGASAATLSESPAHAGAYYAASPSASTIVFVQGQ